MDTLQIAYKILYSLEHKKKADYMGQIIGPSALGVDERKWFEVIQTLNDEGYISGAKISKDILGNQRVDLSRVRITLSGAEYLRNNKTMRKIARVASDVITILKP